MEISHGPVTPVTAPWFTPLQNANKEGPMPILMVALVALAAFGLIGLMLALAVTLEQKKATKKSPGKAA